jgi:hypothetical protein
MILPGDAVPAEIYIQNGERDYGDEKSGDGGDKSDEEEGN